LAVDGESRGRNHRERAMQTFQGTFSPPTMGRIHAPIPIVGPGSLVVHRDAFEVHGLRARSGAGCLITLGVIAAIISVGVVVAVLGPSSGASHRLIGRVAGGVIIAVVLGLVFRRRGVSANAKPWTFRVARSAIRKVEPDPDQVGGVLILLKGSTPKGTLHFIPGGGASIQHVIAALDPD
jgi:hypothetical protein